MNVVLIMQVLFSDGQVEVTKVKSTDKFFLYRQTDQFVFKPFWQQAGPLT